MNPKVNFKAAELGGENGCVFVGPFGTGGVQGGQPHRFSSMSGTGLGEDQMAMETVRRLDGSEN